MGELIRREADALGAGDQQTADFAASVQRRFMAAHLGQWAERFARKVWRRATTPFYAAMAELLGGFIAEERSAIAT